MSTGKKIIYTESAKERLDKFHLEINKEMENYFQERKYVPGDDFIEVTALDIDEVSKRFRIIRPSSFRYTRTLIPIVYSMTGFVLLIVGLFYDQILILMKDDPQRLILIAMGFIMIGMSWAYYYLLKIRDKKNDTPQRSVTIDKITVSDTDDIEQGNATRLNTNTRKIKILSAKYFFDRNYLNVTSKIKELIDNNIFEFTVTNDLMGGDPASGKVKTIEIEYSVDGVDKRISSTEGSIVKLD